MRYRRIGKVLFKFIPDVIRTGMLAAAPSLYPVFEITPSSCNIMLTNRCNMRCLMCRQWRELAREELKTEDWRNIIDDLKENGFRNIHFTGGEPLLREDLKDLVGYCSRRGYTVGMTTNGMMLDAKTLRALTGSGIRSVALSVDAVGEDYEKIRGIPGSFKRLRRAAETLAEAKKAQGIDAYINFTLMKDNIEMFRDVKDLADSMGLPVAICLLDKTSVIFNLRENGKNFWIDDDDSLDKLSGLMRYVNSEMAQKPGSLIMSYPAVDFISRYFTDPRQAGVPCVVSQDRIYVGPYGDVFGGCLSMGTFGNLKDSRFRELKEAERYLRAKKDMFYKKCPGCSCGYLFNIRHTPGLILDDLRRRLKALFER